MFKQIFSLRSAHIEQIYKSLLATNPVFESDHQQEIAQNRNRKVLQRQLAGKLRRIVSEANSERTAYGEANIEWKHLLLALLTANYERISLSNDEMLSRLAFYGVDYVRAKAFFDNRDSG